MARYSDPLNLVSDAHAAAVREDWNAIAEMCEPMSLEAFREHAIWNVSHDPVVMTAEQYIEHMPDMPPEVAAYYAASATRHADPMTRLKDWFPTLRSLQELHALSDTDMFAEYLRGRSPRLQLEREEREGRISSRGAEAIRARIGTPQPPLLLGVTPDGERFAHVVYRWEWPDDDGNADTHESAFQREVRAHRHVQVETCYLHGAGDWRLIADDHTLGLGHGIFFAEPPDDAAEETT